MLEITGEKGYQADKYEQESNKVVPRMILPGEGLQNGRRRVLMLEVDHMRHDDDKADRHDDQGGCLDLNEGVDALHSSRELLHELQINPEDTGDKATQDAKHKDYNSNMVLQEI